MPDRCRRLLKYGLYFIPVTLPLMAATVSPYEDRSGFNPDTVARTTIDFETVRAVCISLPDPAGPTVGGVNFSGGVSRLISSGTCSPPLTAFQGFVLITRLIDRADVVAHGVFTATLPAGTTAVGFDLAVDADPVSAAAIEIQL